MDRYLHGARYPFHDAARTALERDGWTITHDPLTLKAGLHNLYVDLGAERLIGAERGSERIAVEVKSFVGPSEVADAQQALGQYLMYRMILAQEDPAREMILAMPVEAWGGLFATALGRDLVSEFSLSVLVLEPIVKRIIRHYASFPPSHGDVVVETIFDDIDIRQGRISIQHDGTGRGVANDLVDAGVPRADVVLAFKPADVRPLTGFGL